MPEDQAAADIRRRSRRWIAGAALAAGLGLAAAVAFIFPMGGQAPQRTLISETSSIRVEAPAVADFHDTASSGFEDTGGCSEDLY